jgi:hypothetical protein
MGKRTLSRTWAGPILLGSACYFSLIACAIELPHKLPPTPEPEVQLEGVQLVQAAKLVRASCTAICDAFSDCGLASESCRETCQKHESEFVESRSLACAEAMAASYQCLEAALCPVDKATYLNDLRLCELAHDDHIRDVCKPALPEANATAERQPDTATKEVCTTYCNRMADCGITSAEEASGACLEDCIDSAITMYEVSPELCGAKLIDSLSCAQSLACGELKPVSAAIWDAGSTNTLDKCTDSLPDIATCTTALANGVTVEDQPRPAVVEDAVSVRTVTSCASICRLDDACQLGLTADQNTCVSTCVTELDTSHSNTPASPECIDARIDLQFCLSRLTCGEFSEWLSMESNANQSPECLAEFNRIDSCI